MEAVKERYKRNQGENKMIVIIAGSNRTGTSAIAEFLVKEQNFEIPLKKLRKSEEYETYEDELFKDCNQIGVYGYIYSKHIDKILLKYPKASRNILKWQNIYPEAKFIYVLREPRKTIWRQIQIWGHYVLPLWFKYWREYNDGYRNMMQVENLHIVSFERFLKYPELEKEKLMKFLREK